ncbi:hypothetical protein [Aquimarina sp. I32.4]|uniref:hypothetical protein n=1 Tax=Aquimarina sp. I32.4 TaxID=2053903 RepID=UPI000CDE9E43|nr:hypothetical protein [Aquimarina sp. I32.4]
MVLKVSIQFKLDLKAIKDVSLHEKIKEVLLSIKVAKSINEVSFLRKIRGNDNAYKVSVGFYYLVGIMTSEKELTLMRLLHRDEIMHIIKND